MAVPTSGSDWKLIGTTVGIFAVMVTALWTIITWVGANYVVKTAHEDLVNRLNREVAHINDALPRSEFRIWQEERTKTVDRLITDQDKTTSRVEQVIRDRASIESLMAIQKQIDLLRDQLKEFSAREDGRHLNEKR